MTINQETTAPNNNKKFSLSHSQRTVRDKRLQLTDLRVQRSTLFNEIHEKEKKTKRSGLVLLNSQYLNTAKGIAEHKKEISKLKKAIKKEMNRLTRIKKTAKSNKKKKIKTIKKAYRKLQKKTDLIDKTQNQCIDIQGKLTTLHQDDHTEGRQQRVLPPRQEAMTTNREHNEREFDQKDRSIKEIRQESDKKSSECTIDKGKMKNLMRQIQLINEENHTPRKHVYKYQKERCLLSKSDKESNCVPVSKSAEEQKSLSLGKKKCSAGGLGLFPDHDPVGRRPTPTLPPIMEKQEPLDSDILEEKQGQNIPKCTRV